MFHHKSCGFCISAAAWEVPTATNVIMQKIVHSSAGTEDQSSLKMFALES